MKSIISKTGVTFSSGQALSAGNLNKLATTLDEVIDTLNMMLKGFININQELGETNRELTLNEAIRQVPVERRSSGILVRFFTDNGWVNYTFVGENVSDENWYTSTNWKMETLECIDGGEF